MAGILLGNKNLSIFVESGKLKQKEIQIKTQDQIYKDTMHAEGEYGCVKDRDGAREEMLGKQILSEC